MSRYSPILASDHYLIGEDKTLAFTVYPPDATEDEITAGTASPQDITGWVLEFVLRRDPESVNVTLTKTTSDDIVITNGANGAVDVVMGAADTVDLPPGSYFYTLRRNEPGEHNALAHGELVLELGATR